MTVEHPSGRETGPRRPLRPSALPPHRAVAVAYSLTPSHLPAATRLRRVVCEVVAGLICLAATIVLGCEMYASWLEDSLPAAAAKSLLGLVIIAALLYLPVRPYYAAHRARRREIKALNQLFERSPSQ